MRQNLSTIIGVIGIGACLAVMSACHGQRGTSVPDNRPASSVASSTPRDITFATGDGLTFRGVIESPPLHARNGWGMLMIGGGFGNDLDWTVPGEIGEGEQRVQMTISGESHADAPAISAALASRGFVVMRWSTIAVDDPLADEWPSRATPRTLAELLEQTRYALATLRAVGGIESDQVILLGHSLGAARACTLASEDDGVQGLVLLAPAYFTPPSPRQARFEAEGMRYGEDVLRARALPCLAIFGGLDTSRAVNASAARSLAEELGTLDVRLMPSLGHQLGRFEGGRHGPIDPIVLETICHWTSAMLKSR